MVPLRLYRPSPYRGSQQSLNNLSHSLTLSLETFNSRLNVSSSREMWASLIVKVDRFLTTMSFTSMSRLTMVSLRTKSQTVWLPWGTHSRCGTSTWGRSKGSSGGIPASAKPKGSSSLKSSRILTRKSSSGISCSPLAELHRDQDRNRIINDSRSPLMLQLSSDLRAPLLCIRGVDKKCDFESISHSVHYCNPITLIWTFVPWNIWNVNQYDWHMIAQHPTRLHISDIYVAFELTGAFDTILWRH